MASDRPTGWITSSGNRIVLSGSLELKNLRRFLAAIYDLVSNQSLRELVLDFRECTAAFTGPMLMICAQILRHRRDDGVKFDLLLPSDATRAKLFKNANWASLIDPENHQPTQFGISAHIPTIQFTDPIEQNDAATKITDGILRLLHGFSRTDFSAMHWVINEIMDNVIRHSESPVGGLASLTSIGRQNRIEYAIADAGIGIPRSMRESRSEIRSDRNALQLAVREGETSDIRNGQGNGLHGSLEVSRVSSSYFHIHSGYARLDLWSDAEQPDAHEEAIPCNGTLVVGGIDLSVPDILKRALRFQDRPYEPVDAIELNYESGDAEEIELTVREEVLSFGSRQAAEPFRRKLENLLAMAPGLRIRLNFSDVDIVSSSFADEVFGKLFVRIGAVGFANAIAIEGANADIRGLVDRAVSKRAATG